jgi:hypothetical protein
VTAPQRIQQRRTKGWRKPEGAVAVGRGTRWGNPYRVIPVRASGPFDVERADGGFLGRAEDIELARTIAVERYRHALEQFWADYPRPSEIRAGLAGRDLMCWCPLDQPCHADVLLEIANA